MAIPKLALIPSTVGGSVYSVLPSNGDGDFDFTRGTIATRINAQGLIETVAVGDNRLNYPLIDGVVNGCPSLLLEPSRTNLVTYSKDFSNAFWLIQNASVTLNNAISPDGTLNATKLVENASNSTHRILNSAGLTVSGNVSMSIFAKKGERNWIRLTNNNIQGAFFDLENGIIGNITSGFDAKIQSYGNGWYRCSISQLGVANERIGVSVSTDGVNTTYQGDGTSGVYIYGAQLESNSSYPTSYIPTSGTIGTRSAEICNNAGDVNTFNDSEGVIFLEAQGLVNGGENRYISLSDNTSSNRLQIIYTSLTNRLQVGGTSLVGGGFTAINYNSFDQTALNKVAVKYSATELTLFVNGVKIESNSSNASFSNGTLDSFDFSFWNQIQLPFQGKLNQFLYFPTALSDAELATLTTI